MKTLPEKFKTYNNVFDAFTTRNLFRLSSMGLFDELKSAISLGKEANIFTASKADGSMVIVKIYRLQNCNFNKMWSYLQTDPRFKNSKPKRREIIFSWVQREYRNLLAARDAGIRVPTPYKFLANIIVEEFIRDGDKPALQLKSYEMDDKQFMHDQIVAMMKKLYDHGLVHADLSAFNILVQHGQPVFIDMSQSTSTDDPHAMEYLRRDVKNIATFFDVAEDTLLRKIVK